MSGGFCHGDFVTGFFSEGFFPGGFLWLDFLRGDFVGGILSGNRHPDSLKNLCYLFILLKKSCCVLSIYIYILYICNEYRDRERHIRNLKFLTENKLEIVRWRETLVEMSFAGRSTCIGNRTFITFPLQSSEAFRHVESLYQT